jgi:cyclic pyranopterin phosphate synthase
MDGSEGKTPRRPLSRLHDQCGRKITYLRLSLLDRCNLLCSYCRFGNEHREGLGGRALTRAEISTLLEIFVSLGIRKVRLTGGEPLLRSDLLEIVSGLRAIDPAIEIALTTNGLLLSGKAVELKEAGVDSVNISLDSLEPDRFAGIVGAPRLDEVLRGVDAALQAGFKHVGVNVVVMRNENLSEVLDFAAFAVEKNLSVRFIELMKTSATAPRFEHEYVSSKEVFDILASRLPLVPLEGERDGGDWTGAVSEGSRAPGVSAGGSMRITGPARYFRIKGTACSIGFISPYSDDFCDACNRIRLDHRGNLYPCLFSRGVCNLGRLLDDGLSRDDLARAIVLHVKGKRGSRADYSGDELEERPDMSGLGG